jgi:hypothetical protein
LQLPFKLASAPKLFYNPYVMRVLLILSFSMASLCVSQAASESRDKDGPGKKGRETSAAENHPQMRPKPDSTFARAVDWDDGSAEVLTYEVKRSGKGGEFGCRGRLITGRMFLRPDGHTDTVSAGKNDLEILNSRLTADGEEGGVPFSFETVVKMARKDAFRMLRQDQSLQAWPGMTYRALDCRVSPPRLRALSSGGEASMDTVLTRWPVYTEEMLFTYVRALPQRAGYLEEVWFQDWGAEGKLPTRPQFASLSVHSKTSAVREVETWYVTLDRDDGRRSEFWVSAKGLHPVVVAILADGSTWTLQDIARRKFPAR